MVLPAVGVFVARTLASLGVWKAGSGVLSKIVPKARGVIGYAVKWVQGNPAAAAKGGSILGGIGIGGWSISSALSSVGIDDNQLQLVITAGFALAAVAAVGQLLDIQIGGGS